MKRILDAECGGKTNLIMKVNQVMGWSSLQKHTPVTDARAASSGYDSVPQRARVENSHKTWTIIYNSYNGQWRRLQECNLTMPSVA